MIPDAVTEISFVLPIAPTPQERARHSSANGFHRSYKSGKQEANESIIEWHLLRHKPKVPLARPVSVEMRAYMPLPDTASKKAKAETLSMKLAPHTHRPDVDNLEKQIFDALSRMRFWVDDSLVFHSSSTKLYGENPRWEVTIREHEDWAPVERAKQRRLEKLRAENRLR